MEPDELIETKGMPTQWEQRSKCIIEMAEFYADAVGEGGLARCLPVYGTLF